MDVDTSDGYTDLRQCMSPLEHYKNRPAEFEDVSLLDFLQNFEYGRGRVRRFVRTTTKSCVVDFFPRYTADKPEDAENFARSEVDAASSLSQRG